MTASYAVAVLRLLMTVFPMRVGASRHSPHLFAAALRMVPPDQWDALVLAANRYARWVDRKRQESPDFRSICHFDNWITSGEWVNWCPNSPRFRPADPASLN